MLRQKRRVELRFDHADPASLHNTGSRLHTGQLKVRIRHQDRLVARWPPRSRMDSPPVLRARMRREGDGLLVVGTTSEPVVLGAQPVMLAGMTVLGVALLWFGFAQPDRSNLDGLVPLVLGFVLVPVGAALFIGCLVHRRQRFARQADELERGVRSYITTGDTRRHLL